MYYRKREYARSLQYGYTSTRTPVDITNKIDDPELKDRIEKLQQNNLVKQDEWLTKFLDSVLEQFNTKGYLSHAQIGIIEKNEKKYSDESVAAAKEWEQQFDDTKRELVLKAANYYKYMHENNGQPFYFESIAEKVLEDKNFIPTEQTYRKMVENNYVKNWIANSESQPKYAVGDYVTLNSSANSYYNNRNFKREVDTLKEFQIGAIVEIKKPKYNRKGAHICVVLPMGGTELVEIEERLLKKAKGV